MTYLEKYKEEHPGLSDEEYQRIVRRDCPIDKDGNTIRCPSSSMVRPGISTACPVCWNQEIPGTEPSNKTNNEREDGNMSNKFTKKDLKVGYVVKLRNGTLEMVMPVDREGVEFATTRSDGFHTRSTQYTDDLFIDGRNRDYDIMEVYGFSRWCMEAYMISTKDRKLLWKREPEKTCDSCAHKVVCTHVGMCEHYLEKEA